MIGFKGRLMIRLCWLASLKYQDKYIVHATDDVYESPAEICELIYSALKQSLESENIIYFTDRQIKIIKKLIHKMKEYDYNEIFAGKNAYDFVYNNKTWADLRKTAEEIIEICGFKIEDFAYE